MSEKSAKKGRRKAETRTRSQKKSEDARPSTTDAVGSPREENQSSESPARPKSPEANCSICLGELQNKSFTDSCFHTFCFTCLKEWSKVKAVCPLCKQDFKSIIHNVRSIQDYDQYELQQANNNAAEENSRSFHYRTTLTQDRWLSRQQRDQARQLRLLERPSTLTTRSHWQRIRQTATSDFRRRVYAEGLRVQETEPEPGRPRRERNITPEFFQRNPACTHRLVPWLNRELNVLLHNHEDHVQFLLELIIDLIKSYEIGGEVFRTHLDSIIGHRTDHFVHEFIHFARSPYDMCRYDSNAVYHVNPREVDPLSVLTVSSSSDSDDNNNEEPDIFILSPTDTSVNSRDHSYFSRGLNPEPPAERRGYFCDISAPTPNLPVERVRAFLSGIDTADTAHSGWESPIPGPSSLYWSPPHPGSPTMNDRNGTDTTPDSIQTATDMESITEIPQRPGPSNPGDSSDSDENECLVTGFEKPFEERSPMTLSSEDDLETLMAKSRGKRAKKESDKRKKRDQRRSRTPLQYRVQSESRSKSPPPVRRRKSTSRTRQGSRSQQRSRSRSQSRPRYNSNASNQRDRRRRSKSMDRRMQRSRSRDLSDRRRRSRSRSRISERSGTSRRNNRRSRSRSPVNRRRSRSQSRGEANVRRDGRRSRSRERQVVRKQNRRDNQTERRPRSESIEAVVRRLTNAQRGGQDSRGNRRSRDRRSRSWDRRSRSRSWSSRSRSRRSRSRDRRSQGRRSQARDRRSRSRGGRSRSPRRRSQTRRSRSKDRRSDCKKSTSGHKRNENGEIKMPEVKIKLEPASWTVASPERLGPVSKKRRPTGNDTLLSVDSTSRDASIVELQSISHSTPPSIMTDDGSNTELSNGPTTPNIKKLNHDQSVKQSTSNAATDSNHCYTSRENHRSSSNGENRENLNGGKSKQSSSSSSKNRHSSDSKHSQKSATAKETTKSDSKDSQKSAAAKDATKSDSKHPQKSAAAKETTKSDSKDSQKSAADKDATKSDSNHSQKSAAAKGATKSDSKHSQKSAATKDATKLDSKHSDKSAADKDTTKSDSKHSQKSAATKDATKSDSKHSDKSAATKDATKLDSKHSDKSAADKDTTKSDSKHSQKSAATKDATKSDSKHSDKSAAAKGATKSDSKHSQKSAAAKDTTKSDSKHSDKSVAAKGTTKSDSKHSDKSATAKGTTNQSQSSASGETSNPSQSGAATDISLSGANRNVDLNELEKKMREKLTNRLKGGKDSSEPDQSDKDTIAKLF